MIRILDTVDVCVVGAGAAGPAVALHAREAGLNVVLLEAGRRFDMKGDFTDLPFDMLLHKFAWPMERRAPPFMDDGRPNRFGLLNSGWGIGGTTLMYFGNHPRAHYSALDKWDEDQSTALPGGARWRDELAPYYDFLESPQGLPVPNAPMGYGPFDTHNAMTIVGAKNYSGLAEGDRDRISTPQSIPMYDERESDPSHPLERGGYRGQPNNMTTDCWHCANCFVGCHKPENAQLKDKVKRSTNVSFVPKAEALGALVRDRSIVLALLHPDPGSHPQLGILPNLVLYGTYHPDTYGDPALDGEGRLIVDDLFIQPATVAVLSASTTESPRIWLQSNAVLNDMQQALQEIMFLIAAKFAGLDPADPANEENIAAFAESLLPYYVKETPQGAYTIPPNDSVGRHFMTHNENFVFGEYDKPVDMFIGQNSQARVDLPPLGMIESVGVPPSIFANAAFAKDMLLTFDPATGQPVPAPDPEYGPYYDYPFIKFGVDAKEAHKRYRYAKILSAFAEDEPVPSNRVYLDPEDPETFFSADLGGELRVPVVAVQYHPADAVKERTRKLTKICIEMLKSVQKTSELSLVRLYNLNLETSTIFHSMGTMMMGKVVGTDCEAMDGEGNPVERLYVVDASVLPSTLGGPNPSHTIQALALRAAEGMVKRHFPGRWGPWNKRISDSPHFRT